jgi:hypothetical protein
MSSGKFPGAGPAGRRLREAREGSGQRRRPGAAALRWVAGADAIETVEQKANDPLVHVDAYRSLPSSLAVDEAQAGT